MGYSAAQVGEEILRVASHFLNLKETANNAAWDDPDTVGQDAAGQELRRLLESVGWQVGWPYCMAFCKAIYMQAYRNLGASPEVLRVIGQRFNASVMLTFENCGGYSQNKSPAAGAIFFMQKGDTGNGHAGLVVTPRQVNFSTIEGNTSPSPASAHADREGDGVYKKVRSLDFTRKPGLWLRGFLNPMSSDEVARLRPVSAVSRSARSRSVGTRAAQRRTSPKRPRATRVRAIGRRTRAAKKGSRRRRSGG